MYALNPTYPTTSTRAFKRASKLAVKYLRYEIAGIRIKAQDMLRWAIVIEKSEQERKAIAL